MILSLVPDGSGALEHWKVFLLGVVQGFTEFLPVSSSGHLVLFGQWLEVEDRSHGILLEALLHVGTLLPVLWYFRRDLLGMLRAAGSPRQWWSPSGAAREDAELLRAVVVATAVTAAIALPLADRLEPLFESARATAFALLGTTALLVLSRFLPRAGPGPVRVSQAVLVGAAQALAVAPGLSRSGTTIVAGMLVAVPLIKVGRFSFLLSIPAIVGGALVELLRHPPTLDFVLPSLVGMAGAAACGYVAIRWMMAIIARGQLHWFAPYTAALALGVLLLS